MRTLKMTIVLVFCLGLIQVGFAQPDTLWTKTFGRINDEECRSVIQTSDGGFALAGYTQSFGAGDEDMYLVKTDASGDTLWTRTYGSSESDGCNSIIQTADDGFLLAGWTRGTENIGYLVKTDSRGDTLWTRSFSDIWFLESKGWGGIFSVIHSSAGGYSLTGSYFDSNNLVTSCYLIETSDQGDTLWTRKYSYNDTLWTAGVNHIKTTDNGYALLCIVADFDEPITQEAWVIKTDSNGDSIWTKTFDEGNFFDLFSIVENPDGSFSLAGGIHIDHNNDSFLHIGLDALGNEQWTNYYGDGNAWGGPHIRTNDAGYLLVGEKWATPPPDGRDIYAIKTNSTGDTLWTTLLGGDFEEQCNSVIQSDDLGYILAGHTKSFGVGGSDFWVVKTAADPSGIEENSHNNIPIEFTLDQNYPNPFNPSTTIEFSLPKSEFVELKVFNLLGQEVSTLVSNKLNQGNHTYTFDGKNLASGIYYYQLTAGDYREVKKMILLR